MVAVRAFVRHYVIVNALMSLQVAHIAEAGATLRTSVLALAVVDSFDVHTQSLVFVEGFVALRACVLLHVEATGEMKAKTVGLREPGMTVKTGELLLAAVNERVFLEEIETGRTKRATVVQTPKHLDECVFRYTVLAEGLQEEDMKKKKYL